VVIELNFFLTSYTLSKERKTRTNRMQKICALFEQSKKDKKLYAKKQKRQK